MSFTTYVESWSNPSAIVQQMIANKALTSNTRIILAFASFNFTSSDYIPGLENMTLVDVQNLVNLVHSQNAKISLSLGGATYPFAGSDLYASPGDLASNLNQLVTKCGFDGVDFDIEDSYNSVPANFANQAAFVIIALRTLNPTLYITLTTPCQAWSANMYQQTLLELTLGAINAWQPMEYDLWIAPSTTYADQIMWDINYYLTNWDISPNKIILGLMPGNDDMGHNLTLQDALALTDFAKSQNLQGLMTWDANMDAKGQDGNAPYAYLMGIQSQLAKGPVTPINVICSIT